MPSNGGFDQHFNAQAGVDIATHLIVEEHVTQNANDKQELAPAVEKLGARPAELGRVKSLLADAGYYSEANLQSCQGRVEALVQDYRRGRAAAVLWVSHDPGQRQRLGGRRLVIRDARLEPEP